MKSTKYLIFTTLVVGVICISCKKSSDSKTTTTVEYRVTPMNSGVGHLTYRDSSNNDITITLPSEDPSSPFSTDGSKTIHILTKPFTAHLRIDFLPSSYAYDLAILVDGQVKKDTTVSRPINGEIVVIDHLIQ